MNSYTCMICGSGEHVLRFGGVALCSRCVAALGEALGDKLTGTMAASPPEDQPEAAPDHSGKI